jgi:hypothetical protein
VQREPASVREQVQDLAPLRIGRDDAPILALVQVGARLVAAAYVDEERHVLPRRAALGDLQNLGRLVAREGSDRGLQPFLVAAIAVAPLVDPSRRCHAREGPDEVCLAAVDAQRRDLDHEELPVAVHHEARQAVGLGIDAAHGREVRASLDGASQASFPERVVDGFFLEREHADDDLRAPIQRSARKKLPVASDDVDDVAVAHVGRDGRNRTREDPRMSLPERFFTSRTQRDGAAPVADLPRFHASISTFATG